MNKGLGKDLRYFMGLADSFFDPSYRDPRREVLIEKNNFENLINNFFGDFVIKDFQTIVEGYPVANMFVNEKGDLKVEIATTGFDEKDVKVTIEGNLLTIKATEKAKEDGWCLVSGRLKKKSFEKNIRLSSKLNASQAKAEFKNGTVQVIIPIKPEEEIKKIELL